MTEDQVRAGADLRGAALAGRRIDGRSLNGATLAGADLRGCELVEVDLRGCDLEGADLTGALLHSCDVSQADFSGARLVHATLVDVTGERLGVARVALDDVLVFPAWPAGFGAVGDRPRATRAEEAGRRAVLALGRAHRALALDDDAAARAAAAEAAELAPRWGRPWRALGDLLARAGRSDAACDAYREALARDGADRRTARSLARCLVERGDAAAALDLLRALDRHAPGDVAVLRELGWAAARAGFADEARAVLTRAEQLLGARGRREVGVELQLAALDADAGRTSAAYARLRALTSWAADEPEVWRAFGELCQDRLSAPEAAAAAFARYLERAPRDGATWIRQARALAALGDADGALAALERLDALPLDGALAEAHQALAAARPALYDRALRFAELARATRGPGGANGHGGDATRALLQARASAAVDVDARGALDRLLARPDLDDEQALEAHLRAAMWSGGPVALAATPAALRPRLEALVSPPAAATGGAAAGARANGAAAHVATPAPASAEVAALDSAAARLLAAARAHGLVAATATRPRAALLSRYGSALLAVDEGGATVLLEVLFGPAQRAWTRVGRAAEEALASGGGAFVRGAGEAAALAPGVWAARLSPPAAAHAAPLSALTATRPLPGDGVPLLVQARLLISAGTAAPCLAGLPAPDQRRLGRAFAAAWERTAARHEAAALALAVDGRTPALLVDEAPLPTLAGGAAFVGGVRLGPAWLGALLAALARDAERPLFARYGALAADDAALARLAQSGLGTLEPATLEAAATLWLLGHAAGEAALCIEAEPRFGLGARGLRLVRLEAIAYRAELIARGVLGAWCTRLPGRA